MTPEAPKLVWRVAVSSEAGDTTHYWTVTASSEFDAIQLAFALDGGWNYVDHHARDLFALAKTYCEAKRKGLR